MSVEVIWDDAALTTVRYRVMDHWTWDDITAAIERGHQLMATATPPPTSIIVDLTQSRTIPTFARWRGEQLGARTPDHIKLVVMVGDESLGSLFDIFARFLSPKARYTTTLPAARALIAESIAAEP